MSTENTVDKVKLISELKEIHSELFQIYKKLFDFKYKHDEEFKLFIDKEYRENAVGSKEKKAWNDNFCHRASYTLLNKILFVRICEDKGFMRNAEDYVAGEIKDPHIGEKLSKVGLQKWGRLITNYTLGGLIKFAFSDMKKSYSNIVLYKEDKYEILNPSDEELSLRYIDGNKDTKALVLNFENVLNNIIEKLDTNIFNFKYTDGNILGDVYEKFMDRETRKAIGQFYTPEFVIKYILKNTVEEADIVETPFITVADISCGSGHFLIMAYDILREKFLGNIETLKEKYAEKIYTIKKGEKEEQLTGREYWVKEHIHYHLLKHCIYGSDIDSFAVQLTTINLLLKDLDNFTDELNIVQCDSLIKWEEDYDYQDLKYQLEERYVVNKYANIDLFGNKEEFEITEERKEYVLKYENLLKQKKEKILNKEQVEETLKIINLWNVKFDYIVGNPPYIRHENIRNKEYLGIKYEIYTGLSDLLTYFIERGLTKLTHKGKLGLIVSNKFTRTSYGQKVRKFITENYSIKFFKDQFNNRMIDFEDATVDSAIIIIENTMPQNNVLLYNEVEYEQNNLGQESWHFSDNSIQKIINKIDQSGIKIKDITGLNINYGIKTGLNEAFIIDDKIKRALCDEDPRSAEVIKPLLRGRDIKQYSYDLNGLWLLFIPWHFPLHKDETIQGISIEAEVEFKKNYPAVYNYLLKFKERLEDRNKSEVGIRYEWYALQRFASSYYEDFEKEKILYAEIINSTPNKPKFYYDKLKHYVEATGFIINGYKDMKLLLAVLNSTLSMFYIKLIGSTLNSNGIRYKKVFLKELPIINNIDKKILGEIHCRIDELMNLSYKCKLVKLTISDAIDYENIKDRMKIITDEIDILVMKAYGINNIEYLKILGIVELSPKKEILENNEMLILDSSTRVNYVHELENMLDVNTFIDLHINKNMKLELISNDYGYEYETLVMLRNNYIKKYAVEFPWQLYNLSELYEKINKVIVDCVYKHLVLLQKYIGLNEILSIVKEKVPNYDELFKIMRIKNPTKKSIDIIKDALMTNLSTWSSYVKLSLKNEKQKILIKYDSNYYGLAEWSDEIHKQYFMDAIDEYTVNSPSEKKAKDILNLFKDLDIEDKEDYIDIIEDKVKRAFN